MTHWSFHKEKLCGIRAGQCLVRLPKRVNQSVKTFKNIGSNNRGEDGRARRGGNGK